MFGSILGALKGIGSGISEGMQGLGSALGKGMKDEGGGFNWNKLLGATEAFGQGMGPESQIGQAMTGVSQAGRRVFADRATAKAGKLQKAANAVPVMEQTADEAGIPGTLNLPNPSMQSPEKTAGPYAAEPEPAELPILPSLEMPGIEMTPAGYKRRSGQPLMY